MIKAHYFPEKYKFTVDRWKFSSGSNEAKLILPCAYTVHYTDYSSNRLTVHN